jgi:hypothetical protein
MTPPKIGDPRGPISAHQNGVQPEIAVRDIAGMERNSNGNRLDLVWAGELKPVVIGAFGQMAMVCTRAFPATPVTIAE